MRAWLLVPLYSPEQIQHSTPHLLSVLDHNSLFLLFIFVQAGCSVFPWSVLDYVSGVWVGRLHVLCIAHVLSLQVYAGSFETSQQGEMTCHFSQGRYFLGLGSVQWGVGRLSTG
jgi:hypothetical protein